MLIIVAFVLLLFLPSPWTDRQKCRRRLVVPLVTARCASTAKSWRREATWEPLSTNR